METLLLMFCVINDSQIVIMCSDSILWVNNGLNTRIIVVIDLLRKYLNTFLTSSESLLKSSLVKQIL